MLLVEKVKVFNFEGAMRGLRNPKDSWHLSDSIFDDSECCHPNPESIIDCRNCELFQGFEESCIPYIGPKDMKLAQTMIGAGTDESKFLRQIFISMDIVAPLYWWKEFDTYKVGTVANSCSTMHKIHAKPFEREDFSCDRMTPAALACLDQVIAVLEERRQVFVETKDRAAWDDMIQLLPTSFNQMRTCTLNYENLINIYYARRNHKLPEWHVLCDWIMSLPYAEHLIAHNLPARAIIA